MNAAKLRRSRDVPERHPSKIGKTFRFSRLALVNRAFFVTLKQGKSVRKDFDFPTRSPAFHLHEPKRCSYISSGGPSLRLKIGGRL
jgi:hypothetical protein